MWSTGWYRYSNMNKIWIMYTLQLKCDNPRSTLAELWKNNKILAPTVFHSSWLQNGAVSGFKNLSTLFDPLPSNLMSSRQFNYTLACLIYVVMFVRAARDLARGGMSLARVSYFRARHDVIDRERGLISSRTSPRVCTDRLPCSCF